MKVKNVLLIPGGFGLHQEEMTKNIISTLSNVNEDIVVVDIYKGNKLTKLCNEYNLECIKMDIDLNDKSIDYIKLYKKFYSFFEGIEVENLFLYRMPILQTLKYDNVTFAKSLFEKIKAGETERCSFVSVDKLRYQILLIKAACMNSKNVFQYVIDPQEVKINSFVKFNENTSYTCYSYMKYNGMKFMPFFEYSLLNNVRTSNEKEYDFYFECSCFTKDRIKYKDVIEKFKDDNDLFYCRAHEKGKEMIRQSKYYDMLNKSKFTFIIKPYASDIQFSLLRLYEAVCNSCVPLVEEGSRYDLLSATFPDLYDIIVNNNLVCKFDYDDINKKVEELNSNQDNILKQFLNSSTFGKLKDVERLRRFYNKLLNS